MNTLLHIADSALQYHRGKQTGLYGILGVILAIFIYAAWGDLFFPFFEWIGLVSLMDKAGLLHEEAGYLSAYKIFFFIFGVSLLFSLIGMILIPLLVSLSYVVSHKKMLAPLVVLILIVLGPFIFIFNMVKSLFGTKKSILKFSIMSDNIGNSYPEAVHILLTNGLNQQKRNERDKINDTYKFSASEEEYELLMSQIESISNTLTLSKTKERLNRIPAKKDSNFIIGVTHGKEIFMLLPKPYYPHAEQGVFFAVKLYISTRYDLDKHQKMKRYPSLFKGEIPYTITEVNWHFNNSFNGNESLKVEKVKFTEFDLFLDPRHTPEVVKACSDYALNKDYNDYCKHIQDAYFNLKEKTLSLVSSSNSRQEFDTYVLEAEKFNAWNEDVVKYIWEGNKL